MKTKISRLVLFLSVASFLLFGTTRVFAEPPAANLLRQAYATLEMADHDYKGHRVDAMKQIEAAGHALGISVRGDGRGHEKQGVSDEQLRAAESLLEQARPSLKGRALHHVNHALKQIHIALSIK